MSAADNVKNLFKGKKGKYMIAGIVVVAFLALYLKSRNSSSSVGESLSEYPTYQGGTTSGETSSSGSELTSMLQTERDNQAEIDARQNANVVSILDMLSGLEAELHSGLLANANTNLENSTVGAIIDNTDYSPTNSYQGDTNPNTRTAEAMPTFGYGGVDYNKASTEQKKDMQANAAKLSSDPVYKASETDRTKQVIADRKAMGLDTTLQEKYLNNQLAPKAAPAPAAVAPAKAPTTVKK